MASRMTMFSVGVVFRHKNGDEELLWGKRTPYFSEAMRTFKKQIMRVKADRFIFVRVCAYDRWDTLCEYDGTSGRLTMSINGDSVDALL